MIITREDDILLAVDFRWVIECARQDTKRRFGQARCLLPTDQSSKTECHAQFRRGGTRPFEEHEQAIAGVVNELLWPLRTCQVPNGRIDYVIVLFDQLAQPLLKIFESFALGIVGGVDR